LSERKLDARFFRCSWLVSAAAKPMPAGSSSVSGEGEICPSRLAYPWARFWGSYQHPFDRIAWQLPSAGRVNSWLRIQRADWLSRLFIAHWHIQRTSRIHYDPTYEVELGHSSGCSGIAPDGQLMRGPARILHLRTDAPTQLSCAATLLPPRTFSSRQGGGDDVYACTTRSARWRCSRLSCHGYRNAGLVVVDVAALGIRVRPRGRAAKASRRTPVDVVFAGQTI